MMHHTENISKVRALDRNQVTTSQPMQRHYLADWAKACCARWEHIAFHSTPSNMGEVAMHNMRTLCPDTAKKINADLAFNLQTRRPVKWLPNLSAQSLKLMVHTTDVSGHPMDGAFAGRPSEKFCALMMHKVYIYNRPLNTTSWAER